jgi:regulator of protease activity HflC (stomatin/prohibitin superfamily)
MKISVMDLQRQSIITKDNVSINIDASVYFKVVNSRYAYYRVQNFNVAIA